MATRRNRDRRRNRRRTAYVVIAVVLLATVAVAFYLGQSRSVKPVILYVNQGNGVVDTSNFAAMLSFASSHGFNTVFFQVYRQGVLLFDGPELANFVNESHSANMKIFFAFYITNSSQTLPDGVFGFSEDGISLDMSALSTAAQESELANLQSIYHGETAVTTTDMASPLKPDLLVLETYGSAAQQYVRHGTVASVGVFATSSRQDYDSQFQYALDNSDGVMVFDYAGLVRSGY